MLAMKRLAVKLREHESVPAEEYWSAQRRSCAETQERENKCCTVNIFIFLLIITRIAIMPGMMDKGSEYLGKGRSNGTKSPSNASNGHFSDESGSDDEHGIASNTPAEVVYTF